jgi:thioredoxin reductase (NADPH)
MAEQRDVVIIGAGPAGLGGAVYTGRSLMKTTVLEKRIVGGQIIESYDVDNYPGFPEGITGPDLVDRLAAHARKFDVELVNDGAEDIVLDGPYKRVLTGDGTEYVAPIVIVASGAYHRKLGIPGEKELSGRGVSYCATCDGPFFRGKRLVVVGGGDAALTEGLFLTRFASSIKLLHRREEFRAQTAYVNEARENPKIEFVLNTVVVEIRGEGKVQSVTARNVQSGETSEIECEGVFIFIGHDPNTGFLKTILPQFAGGIVPVDINMETEVEGVYAVGDVRVGSCRQVGTAIGDAITAAMHAEKRMKELLAGVE